MKTVITSFSSLRTAEGENISFTYSEIDAEGNKVKENVRKSIIVMDDDIEQKIKDIKDFLVNKAN